MKRVPRAREYRRSRAQCLYGGKLVILAGETGQIPPHPGQRFPLRQPAKAGGLLTAVTGLQADREPLH